MRRRMNACRQARECTVSVELVTIIDVVSLQPTSQSSSQAATS